MSEFLEELESSDREKFEEAKKKILDQCALVRDPWLVNGLYNYYLETNSAKIVVILVNIREPHHQYLFDRLSESISARSNTTKPNNNNINSTNNDHKIQALTLLGHIVRCQPMWLYKLPEHHLLKDLLKLLKNEGEILPLISALLVLIVLIPMIPYAMAGSLTDIFDIFSRLAAWNFTPGRLIDELVHMQVVLHALFLRLYGMFPCNFLSYLRTLYKDRNRPVFIHTIKPMLESVKVNPSLVTTSKDNETTNERWRRMAVHDIIVECERYSVDFPDNQQHQFCCPHDSTCPSSAAFRSRSGTNSGSKPITSDHHVPYIETVQKLSNVNAKSSSTDDDDSQNAANILIPVFLTAPNRPELVKKSVLPSLSPTVTGTSPPEAAIEATPETTSTDATTTTKSPQQQQRNSHVDQGYCSSPKTPSSGGAGSGKKEQRFSFPAVPPSDPKMILGPPSSPLKIIHADGGKKSTAFGGYPAARTLSDGDDTSMVVHSNGSNGTDNDDDNGDDNGQYNADIDDDNDDGISVEQRRVRKETMALRQVDSVLHESEESTSDNLDEDRSSPCSMGGLHMPNSRSMKEFAQRVKRMRHHSQCTTSSELHDVEEAHSNHLNSLRRRDDDKNDDTNRQNAPIGGDTQYCSSSNNNNHQHHRHHHYHQHNGRGTVVVRRTNSCPEMKKSPVSSFKDYQQQHNTSANTLNEEDDDIDVDHDDEEGLVPSTLSNGGVQKMVKQQQQQQQQTVDLVSSETQTYNFWPMPYEHLFLSIFPMMTNTMDATTVQSTALDSGEKCQEIASIYDVLDRYIEASTSRDGSANNATHCLDLEHMLKTQVQLLHQQLLFERHRREIHAFKNRRFMAEAKNTQVLEEHNSALRDQVQLQQADNDNLKSQLIDLQTAKDHEILEANKSIVQLQDRINHLEALNASFKSDQQDINRDLNEYKCNYDALVMEKQQSDCALSDALTEAKFAKEQALAGERGRAELEFVNKQLVLIGDLHVKYKERLEDLNSLRRSDHELELLRESYSNELKYIEQSLQEKINLVELSNARVDQLEQSISARDELLANQRQLLVHITNEHEAKLQAVDAKYRTQLVICQAYESKLLDVYRQLELVNCSSKGSTMTAATLLAMATPTTSTMCAAAVGGAPPPQISSPDTSSCQEACMLATSLDRSVGGVLKTSDSSLVFQYGENASSSLSCSLASSSNDSATTTPAATASTTLNFLSGSGQQQPPFCGGGGGDS